MKLFITRHGQTDMNVKEQVSGITEAQLTETGLKQAEELARLLKKNKEQNNIEYIYVSPLIRARKTAEPIEEALGLKAEVDDRLMEMNFGIFEKRSWTHNAEFRTARSNPLYHFPEGESFIDVIHRGYNIIEDVEKKRAGHNVLFVCHNTISRALSTYFNDYTIEELNNWKMDNCQLYKFDL